MSERQFEFWQGTEAAWCNLFHRHLWEFRDFTGHGKIYLGTCDKCGGVVRTAVKNLYPSQLRRVVS